MLPATVSFFGLSIHLYGVVIGLALILALWLIEKKYVAARLNPQLFNWLVLGTLLGGVLGARAWHVATDFSAYAQNPLAMFYIWQGGLSIFGALLGGGLSLWLVVSVWNARFGKQEGFISIAQLLDLVVFGLPAAQAVGRVANYVNQELYGLPTSRWWGIYISPERRFSEYVEISHYHPLFAYEAFFTGIFALVIWRASVADKLTKLAAGKLFVLYLLYYAVVRLYLDFLRLQKATVIGMLGINQLVLIGVSVLGGLWLVYSQSKILKKTMVSKVICWFGVAVVLFGLGGAVYGLFAQNPDTKYDLSTVQAAHMQLTNGELASITIGDKVLKVEVASTPASISQGLSDRDEIGSDGMLFVFPERMIAQFWMRKMRFDLDIVWIVDGKVAQLDVRVPKPPEGVGLAQLPVYTSQVPVDMVLELPAGAVEALGIGVGDLVGLVD